MGKTTRCAAAMVALAWVVGCADGRGPTLSVRPEVPAADVNASTPAQRQEPADRRAERPVTLEEMREVRASRAAAGSGEAERLRAPALRDNALRYGAQGGLAWGSREIQQALHDRATELGRTYDFNALMIRRASLPGGILPPVIVESREPMEQQDGGRTLRVADRHFEIVQQARFASAAPLWQSYLDMERFARSPELPMEPLPRNEAEREMWRRFVTEGWNEGLGQASEIFRSNIRRLQRDFVGMARYARLIEEGKVSAPMVADANLGVTGSGQNMRVNDQVFRITRDPRLRVGGNRDWRAAVGGDAGAEEPPVPRTAESARGGRIAPTPPAALPPFPAGGGFPPGN